MSTQTKTLAELGPIPPAEELLKKHWTISELRKLPREWQAAIMDAQLSRPDVQDYYRNDPDVKAWLECGLEIYDYPAEPESAPKGDAAPL